jgi:lysozyme family protein
MSRFDDVLAFSLRSENDGQHFHVTTGDPGGATNEGILVSTLSEYYGRPATVEELRDLDMFTIEDLYHELFWDRLGCDALPVGVDLMVFDCSVVSGTGNGAKFLQRAVRAYPDGAIGDKTRRAVAATPTRPLIGHIAIEAGSFYKADRNFSRFGKGWTRRNNDRVTEALADFDACHTPAQ